MSGTIVTDHSRVWARVLIARAATPIAAAKISRRARSVRCLRGSMIFVSTRTGATMHLITIEKASLTREPEALIRTGLEIVKTQRAGQGGIATVKGVPDVSGETNTLSVHS